MGILRLRPALANWTRQLGGAGAAPNLLDAFFEANPPLLRYKLDEATGVFVNTGTASGFSGTASGTMDRAQPSGTLGAGLGIEVDGATSLVLVLDGAAIDGLAAITILAVARPDSAGETSQGLIVSKVNEWTLRMASGTRLTFERVFGTTNALAISANSAFAYGTVYAFAARIDTDKVPTLRINGVAPSYGTRTTGVGTLASTAQNLHIASANGAITFDGGIFDVAVFASALTDQQIIDHYNAVFF